MKLNELLSPELYAQVQARIDEVNAGQTDKTKFVRFADLSEGGYVSVDKYTAQTEALRTQITDLQGQITQRDADIADLNGKLTATAQNEATKLTEAQNALAAMQTRYETDRQAWEQKDHERAYGFMVKEKASSLAFTSPAARRDFIREATEKQFQIDGNSLLGYDDFVTKYKADNPGAIKEPEDPEKANPTIVLPQNKQQAQPEKNGFSFNFNGVRARKEE